MLERNPRPLTSPLPLPLSSSFYGLFSSPHTLRAYPSSPSSLPSSSFVSLSVTLHFVFSYHLLFPKLLSYIRVSLYPCSLGALVPSPSFFLAQVLYHWFPFQVGAHSKKEARGFLSAPIKASPRCPILIRALICGEILRHPLHPFLSRPLTLSSVLPLFYSLYTPLLPPFPSFLLPTSAADVSYDVDKINRRYPRGISNNSGQSKGKTISGRRHLAKGRVQSHFRRNTTP